MSVMEESGWEPDRARIVRLCAAISGDVDIAEDLAQETLLEAWRNVHKLRDAAGADAWLAAVARNVCLRWARRHAREAATVEPLGSDQSIEADTDIELDLEKDELAALLDQALALLPPDTRDVLVHRYIHGSPYAEIAERLGLSEDAVSMRLSRGKLVLRRILGAELREEAIASGLIDPGAETWRPTRIWCATCGMRNLLIHRDAAAIAFSCPGCDAGEPGSLFPLSSPVLGNLLGSLTQPAAIWTRAADWLHGYFSPGADAAAVPCAWCARAVVLRTYVRDPWRPGHPDRRGLVAECGACGEQTTTSLRGLALAVPEVRRFRREHPRLRPAPVREIEVAGLPAVLVRYEDRSGDTGVDTVFARDSLRVVDVIPS